VTLRPWKHLGGSQIADCRVFKVRSERFRSPTSGRERDFFVIDCPDWVNVLALTGEGRIVLVRQHRFGTDRISLEIPGGVIDPGESPAAAGARELLEETGYRGEPPVLLGKVEANPALQPNSAFTYLISGCRKVAEQRPDEDEELEVVEAPLSEIDGLLRSGEISHALVLAAFMHWKLKGSPGA
jgi:8-oxo-dGTP pyrophosphatase MutT (NUDIX family)